MIEEKDKKIVLVVEDDEVLLKYLQTRFRSVGVEPAIARDGEECLRLIKQLKPNFVVLDILMPKINGLEVLKSIREDEVLKNTPVLILTNFSLEAYKQKAHELGVVDFLIKMNVSPDDVVKKVFDYLSDVK